MSALAELYPIPQERLVFRGRLRRSPRRAIEIQRLVIAWSHH